MSFGLWSLYMDNLSMQAVNSEFNNARLWKSLDGIASRLSAIEQQLSEVVRLEERVNNHEQSLSRYGNKLDNHDRRIHETELWQASHGDRGSVERMLTNLQDELGDLRKKINDLETAKDVTVGQKDVSDKIFKWLAALAMTLLVFYVTKK